MNSTLIIRDEREVDYAVITTVTKAAFKTLEISNHTEQNIINALRDDNALTVSLVAEYEGGVVGHIAFSPINLSDGTRNWFGLGPVSVLPEYQRKGIGKSLINSGLLKLKDINAGGCCLVGHPEYYRQLGFENTESLILDGVPPEVFFSLSLDGLIPKAKVTFHPAFFADYSQQVDGANE